VSWQHIGIAKSALGEFEQIQTGMIGGIPAYLLPEQAQGLPVGPSSDIDALGVVFVRAVGRPTAFKARRRWVLC
jgi:hypothetical protein